MDAGIPQNCDGLRTEIFGRTSHENSAKEAEKSTTKDSGGTNVPDGNTSNRESKGKFPGDSPSCDQELHQTEEPFPREIQKQFSTTKTKDIEGANNALCQSDQLCSLFGIGFSEGKLFSRKMPKS
jgi:hypothetical protein